MNKTLLFFVGVVSCMAANAAWAVTIKKAAPVATQQASASSSTATASLLPGVLQLVSGVQQLNKQNKALTEACIPSAAEISFVNNTIKEWAKTGAATADDVQKSMKRSRCASATGGYEVSVKASAGTDAGAICYNYFSDENMIWHQFPMVGSVKYCADGSSSCSGKEKHASDIYEIFNLIDFTEADYTKQEATMAANLIAKIENCSAARLSDKKRAAWGEFITTTIGNVGQSTNTGAIMQSVGSLTSGGGLSSLGAIASQFIGQ